MAVTATALALATAPAALGAWGQPVASPVNLTPLTAGDRSDITIIGGLPHVAWTEPDGANTEVHVARLSADGSVWERVGEALVPSSPVNRDALRNAGAATLADVGGVPYVAWVETDGTNREVRVARPNAAGNGWDKVGETLAAASPINQSDARNADDPVIANIGGAPVVAWAEADGKNTEIRAARLNAAGTGWDKLGQTVDPASPVNQNKDRNAVTPSLADVGGQPYVAWAETDGKNVEIRVARPNATATAWEKVGQTISAASPVNNGPTNDAAGPSVAAINGTPHVAWYEGDGTNNEVRVARLAASGSGWEKVAQATRPGSPINQSASRNAAGVSLADIGGAPWVSWVEADGTGNETRVSRPNSTGTAWSQPAGGLSPINATPTGISRRTSIASAGGIPWLSWTEDEAGVTRVRVSRLTPDYLGFSAASTDTSAQVQTSVKTYGLPYSIGFSVSGPGGVRETRPGPTSGDPANASARIGSLQGGGTYTWRPFALTTPSGQRALGPETSFTAAPSPAVRVRLSRGRRGPVRLDPGARLRLRYTLTTPARVTIEIRRGGKIVRRLSVGGQAGDNVVRVRLPRRQALYRVRLVATRGVDGRRDVTSAVRVLVRR
jgi:hypothetical protein